MRHLATFFGAALAVVGASTDFVSGYFFLLQSTVYEMEGGVATYHPIPLAWSVGTFALGALVLGTAFAISVASMKRMRLLGLLMALYGAAMIFLGALMNFGMVPMGVMTAGSVIGLSMLAVGAPMMASGFLMFSRTAESSRGEI